MSTSFFSSTSLSTSVNCQRTIKYAEMQKAFHCLRLSSYYNTTLWWRRLKRWWIAAGRKTGRVRRELLKWYLRKRKYLSSEATQKPSEIKQEKFIYTENWIKMRHSTELYGLGVPVNSKTLHNLCKIYETKPCLVWRYNKKCKAWCSNVTKTIVKENFMSRTGDRMK